MTAVLILTVGIVVGLPLGYAIAWCIATWGLHGDPDDVGEWPW